MKRRFLLRAIPAAVGTPLITTALRAEADKLARIGYLTSGKPGGAFDTFRVFREGMLRLGYVEGQSVAFETRYGEGGIDQLVPLAEELLKLGVNVIALSSAVALRAVTQTGTRIPIVFAVVPSPAAVVEMGFVASVDHPGANVTGFSSFDPNQADKSFQLLKEALPNVTSVAIVSDQDIPHSKTDAGWNPLERAYDTAARKASLRPLLVRLKGPNPDLDVAFATIAQEKIEAIRVLEVDRAIA